MTLGLLPGRARLQDRDVILKERILEAPRPIPMPSSSKILPPLFALLLLCLNLPAQTLASRLNKPPAGVEEALRDRIMRFFALQSEGKFRQGESFVCEDSKDAYYDSYKNRWTSVAIISFTWEDSFQTGKVLVSLGTELKTLAGTIPANYPLTTIWKVQNGNWCYYVPPVETTQAPSPFGTMKPGPTSPDGDLAMNRRVLPTVSDFAGRIRVSKSSLNVLAYEDSTDSLDIQNGLGGIIKLRIYAPEMPGLKWTLSTAELKQNEKAALTVVYKPVDRSNKTPFNLNIEVEPSGGMMTIPVVFAPPPAAQPLGPIPLPKH